MLQKEEHNPIDLQERLRLTNKSQSQLGVIHPEHFNKAKSQVKRKQRGLVKNQKEQEQMTMVEMNLMAKSVTLRAKETSHQQKIIGSHLSQPFVYIRQVNNKQLGGVQEVNHSEKYNPSNNCKSSRRHEGISKQTVTLQTIHQIAGQAGIQKNFSLEPTKFTEKQRDLIYENNLAFGEKIKDFFDKIRLCILAKDYQLTDLQKYIPHKNKDNEQTLRTLFDIFIKYAKLDFKRNPQRNIKMLQFQDFLNLIGIKSNQQIKDIFNNCLKQPLPFFENEDLTQTSHNINNQLISMKSFIYNYENMIKKELKIHNILKKESAIDRNKELMLQLKEGLKNSFELKQVIKEKEKEEMLVIQELESCKLITEEVQTTEGGIRRDTYMLNTEEKEEKQTKNDDKKQKIDLAIQNNMIVDKLLSHFNNKQQQRDNLKFEKDQIQQFLIYALFLHNRQKQNDLTEEDVLLQDSSELFSRLETYHVLRPLDLVATDQFNQMIKKFTIDRLDTMESFLGDFMREKIALGEPSFSLLEAGEFMFKHKYNKKQVEIISGLLKKAGGKWGQQQKKEQWGEGGKVDGETQIDMEHILKVYQSMDSKYSYRETLLDNFLKSCQQVTTAYLNKNRPSTQSIRKVHDENVLVVFMQKYLQQIDEALFELQVYLKHTHYAVANTPCLSLLQFQAIIQETTVSTEQTMPNNNKGKKDNKKVQKISFYDQEQFKQKNNFNQFVTNLSNDNDDDDVSNALNTNNNYSKPDDDINIIDFLNPSKNNNAEQKRVTINENSNNNNNNFNNNFNNDNNNYMTNNNDNFTNNNRSEVKSTIVQYNNDYPQDDKNLSNYVRNQSQLIMNQSKRTEENQELEEKKLLDFFQQQEKNKTLESLYKENPMKPQIQSKQLDLSYLDPSKQHNTDYNAHLIKLGESQNINNNMTTSRMFMESKLEKYDEGRRINQNTLKNRSELRFSVDENYFKDSKVGIENGKIKSDNFIDFQVNMPLEYYDDIMKGKDKYESSWHVRPHHLETLTQDRKSLKDNLIASQYQSYIGGRGEVKQEDVHDGNIRTKEEIIQELEDQLVKVRKEVEGKKKIKDGKQVKEGMRGVERKVDYYQQVEAGEKDTLHLKSYESILLSLRQQEKEILNNKRGEELQIYGRPDDKWYESKTTDFQFNVRKNYYHNVADPEGYGQYADRLEATHLY